MTTTEKIQELTDKLEEGVSSLFESDTYKKYLQTMSKFHNYSPNNCLLISLQCPEATHVMGYESWKKGFGRQVNNGEKAIKIIAPAPYKKKIETPVIGRDGTQLLNMDGSPMVTVEEKIIPAFKVTNVFDISQTTGPDLPEICHTLSGKVQDYDDMKRSIIQFSPVPIEIKSINSSANGFYSNTTKTITIKEGMSEAQTIKTMIHEIAHSILHDKDAGIDHSADHRTKEVQAESVAFVVTSHYGLDASDYSFGYIAGWSSGKEMSELKASLDTIQKTASHIICGIDVYRLEIERERSLENTELEPTVEPTPTVSYQRSIAI